jgi:hypothetical protein
MKLKNSTIISGFFNTDDDDDKMGSGVGHNVV